MARIDDEERGSVGMDPPVREAYPALGRQGAYLRQEREQNGNLQDDPGDLPTEVAPMRVRKGG